MVGTNKPRHISGLLLGLGLLFLPAAKKQADASNPKTSAVAFHACSKAAKVALGLTAEVLKCGQLTGTRALEAVAAVRFGHLRTDKDGIPVSKFVILRQRGSQWTAELTADQESIRNTVGYVATDYINETPQQTGYRVSFDNQGSQASPGFSVRLYYLNPSGQVEGATTQISWNPRVGRFQEYTENEDLVGFRPELRNPPHIRIRGTAQ